MRSFDEKFVNRQKNDVEIFMPSESFQGTESSKHESGENVKS